MANALTRTGWSYHREPDFSSGTYTTQIGATKIRAFWDPRSKNWIVYALDANGYQFGACELCYSIDEVPGLAVAISSRYAPPKART